MSLKILTVMACAAALLGGCSTPQPIITPNGVGKGAMASLKADGTRPSDNETSDIKSAFRAAEEGRPQSGLPVGDDQALTMLSTGFDLIQSNCQDYFRKAGANQRGLYTAKDVTVATAAFAASVMGVNPRNKKPLSILPILTGGIYAGMDVYTKNFLYSAENVNAVAVLTYKALDEHRKAQTANVEAYIDSGHLLTYGKVVNILQENQAYCTPSGILPVVRSAIEAGNLKPVEPAAPPPPADTRSANEVAADAVVLKTIGALYGQPGPISLDQAMGYYWLYQHDSTPAERVVIAKLLSDMDDKAKPLQANGKPSDAATYVKEPSLETEVAKLSPPTKAVFDAAIKSYRDKVKGKDEAKMKVDAGEMRFAAKAQEPLDLPRAVPKSSTSASLPTVTIRAR